MNVEAKLFATLKFKLGVGKISVESDGPMTVRELLARIGAELDHDILPYLIDDDDTILPGTMILVGGKNIHHLDGLDTVIEAPEVAIFPPSGGG
jgi:molybdopterin synthase sulfur carrier subunit